MVTQSWFRSLWTPLKKNEFHTEKAKIAVLAFEAASLMTKLLHLWQSMTDKQVARLREEINDSLGIKKLVSESDEYIGKLICAEMMENLVNVARALARLSKRCNDPLLRSFEQAFNDLIKGGTDTYGWQFSWRKMERKVKKMERFIVANANLYQEMETLADLEQALKRMKGNDSVDSITLVEYEKKIAWKRQEVKHLKENSLWSRTYDYTILLMARSLFTTYGRIGHVFGVNHITDIGANSRVVDNSNNRHSHSTAFMQSSVYPSENYVPRVSTGTQGKFISSSGPLLRTNNMGPLSSSTAKPGPTSKTSKSSLRMWHFRDKSHKAEKISQRKPNGMTMSGPLTGSVVGGNGSWTGNAHLIPGDAQSGVMDGKIYGNLIDGNLSVVASKSKLLNPPPETLGASALALHYANLIIFIEKLVASPHLIGNDARDDVYNMLPASIRSSLRAKLKPFARSLSSSVYDTALANEWNDAMSKTLEWLAPLAHNMIRWQSERSFEHQSLVSRTNVLLVQTLYFANQEKTEAQITELLVGLNYIWRFGREITAKSLAECASGRTFDEYQE
ncbi:uncharacterized protein LOC125199771 [Salvia hispanica]|uniref:uncharacterized protein LOC125199771 n=1 Tax=Salvia hispanica TaxID=49212 RepID=UPI0020096C6E|nr:uncharacterized protein LOC125199771 [Salvia hispanica]